MARLSLLSLARPKLPEFTLRNLADPAQPDFPPFDLTLRKLDSLQQTNLSARADAFYQEYQRAGGWMPLLSGDAVEITREVANIATSLELMQVAPEEERRSIQEFVALMACMDEVYSRLLLVSTVLNKGALPEEMRPRIEAEGPELLELAERFGCFGPAPPVEPESDDSGNGYRAAS